MSCNLARPGDSRVCNFKRRNPVKVSYHSAKSGGHSQSDSGDVIVFVCHVTLQDHLIKVLFDFMV